VQDPLSDTTVRDSKRNHTCTAGSRTQGRHYARNVYNVSSTYIIIHLEWHTLGTYDSKPACKPSQMLFTKTSNEHRYVYAETITKSNGNSNLSIAVLFKKKQDRQCTYNVTLRRVRESLLPWKSSKYYISVYMCARECVSVSGCVHVAFFNQHETRMRHIVTSYVTPLAPSYFSTLSHKRRFF
jgi:hypothetical protein